MDYQQNRSSPAYSTYKGLEIHADLAVHLFVKEFAKNRLSTSSDILDIAAGSGALSRQLIDLGKNVSCTSWNGKSSLSIPTYPLDLDLQFNEKDVGNRKYDFVSAIEIIEHLENPTQFIRSLRSIIKPDGFLIISTPNVESALSRLQWLLRGCPYSFSAWEVKNNRHISLMWREGLEFSFEMGGFKVFEKHLLGEPRFVSLLQKILKKPIISLMEHFLSGDIRGTSRVYVLSPVAGKLGSRLGPNDVA